MWPDRVSNPGPLTYESDAYRLRYAARPVVNESSVFEPLKLYCTCRFEGKSGGGENRERKTLVNVEQ